MSSTASLGRAERPSVLSIWFQAIRPATLPAAIAPVVLGIALAVAHGVFVPLPALVALIGAVLIQIGTNLANDYFDFKKGADTEARLGPARVTQRGWISPNAVALATAMTFGLAIASGLYLFSVAGWQILVLGLISVGCGIAYTGGPFPLAYVGLGDLFVLVFFGPVAVAGTYFVQARVWSIEAMLVAVPVGLLMTAILVVNNLRDRHTDAVAGKRTLAVRFGEEFTRVQYNVLVLGAHLWLVALVASGMGHIGWLLPVVSLPLTLRQIRVVKLADGAALNPQLGATARLGLVFSALLSLGVML